MGELFQPMHLLVILLVLGMSGPLLLGPLVVVPCWQIFKKAGFPAPLSLLLLVPVGGLVVLYLVAFSRCNKDANAALDPGSGTAAVG